MARIRTIKPEFFTSEDIVSLSPLARLFYVSLWCEADREGRLSWRPGTLKMRYLPGDDCSVEELAQELIKTGLIAIYEVDGRLFAHIPTFGQHQVINNRESPSVIPEFTFDASSRVQAEGRKEGREGKGKERKEGESDSPKGSRPPVVQCPDDVDQQTWDDWLSLRKTKRAPVTETVLQGARDEAEKAGIVLQAFLRIWCTRGSQGLQADWLKPSERAAAASAVQESFRERDARLARERYAEMVGRPVDIPGHGEIIDITPINLEIEHASTQGR